MSKFLNIAVAVGAVALCASAAQAQTVGFAGGYNEANGIIIDIPQNPPQQACSIVANDGQCMQRRQFLNVFGGITNINNAKPNVGNLGNQNIATVGGGGANPAGLNVGDPFQIPALAFQQRYGTQVGIVLNNRSKQLDTAFTAAFPVAARLSAPPALTRQFSAGNFSAVGNGHNTNLGGGQRAAANTTVNDVFGTETVAVRYSGGGFGGTAGILLDGTGWLYLQSPGISAAILGGTANIIPSQPVILAVPVGDGVPGFATRNAVGWGYTVTGGQDANTIKRFNTVATPGVWGGVCGPTAPPSPAGCNEVNGYDTNGILFGMGNPAVSTKFMFAWTTGTVSITRQAIRGGVSQTDTLTGMGYDTTVGGPGPGAVRNVGLVAGSYTKRDDGQAGSPDQLQLNTQLAGMNLQFTPEPGATVALLSGLGMLSALAVRRRR